ncbi:MAG TPA: TIGR02680 family protein, partial [Thermoanaerobaculia bacterium]|nr:TIGR02680 family protein [Thermoanaerobaculia bacterium]
MLLPFLFDADLSPYRLDPFGGNSRTMEWNLLQGGRFDQRVGYVWLELGRRGKDGEESAREEIIWTLGCGLRAGQRTRRVDAWYFLTRRRVGRDLALTSAQRTPLLRDQLRQQIGEEGWIFDTGREYREKLDTQIFGLGEDRFATLCHLLLQLRRPHLSERLDPSTLSEILKESLPPLDGNLIAQLSESFERLDNEQKELVRVEAAVTGVAGFLEIYREYGRGVARARAAEVRQTDSRYHKTAAEVREAEEESGRLEAHLADLTERVSAEEEAVAVSRGTLRALEQSDEMRSAEALRAKWEHAEALSRRAGQEREDAQREERHREECQRDWDGAAVEAKHAETGREEAGRAALAAARESGLEAVAGAAVAALAERVSTAEALVRAAVERRKDAIAELRRLVAERERARRDEERSEDKLREADARLRQAVARTLDARAKADRERQDLTEALLRWAEGLEELRLDAVELESLGARLEEEGGLAAALGVLVTPRRDALVRQRTTLDEETARTNADRGKAEDERRRVEAARELGPEPPRTRAASREERPGGPLYLLCDFVDGLGGEERAGLEAALEAAGLLDAWVLPDGGLLPAGAFDTCLVPAPEPLAGSTLADFLRPVPGHGVETATIAAILRSVSVASAETASSEGSPARVSPGGAFRLGPLQGAWTKPEAEHLGAGAREAARARRLAEIAALLAGFDRRLAELADRGEALEERLERLDREAAALPSQALLTRALHLAEAAEGDEIRRRTERDQAETEAASARAARQAAEQRLLARAREHDLAGWIDDLEGARERLASFKSSFDELVRSVKAASVAAERSEQARLRLVEAN